MSNIIWLDGVPNLDITDFHIDGFAKFHNKSTIVTMKEDDLAEWGLSNKDMDTLLDAKMLQEISISMNTYHLVKTRLL